MNLKALALTALAVTTVGFATPTEARNVPVHMLGQCVVNDPNDTYANFRNAPNGDLNQGLGNGTPIGRPNAQKAGWTLFNGIGWIKDGLFNCEIMS